MIVFSLILGRGYCLRAQLQCNYYLIITDHPEKGVKSSVLDTNISLAKDQTNSSR